ncbi:hypothetical protein SLS62_010752 [Diatrype stigma]|uniref:Uncharacterized protein n=1 Tax=Diatrype stigma TaxID=117547 RepID=A0AAN9UEZ0_9PEZI
MFRHLSTKRAGQSSKPKFSFGKQLEPLSPLREEAAQAVQNKGKNKQANNNSSNTHPHPNHNWLAEAEARLKEDYAASKRELELIRTAIEELGQRLASLPPDPPLHQHQSLHHKYPQRLSSDHGSNRRRIRDHKALMTACLECSRSRVHLLRERTRQVAFWSDNRRLGLRIPERAPAEWATADREWAQWLAEQAVARAGFGAGAGAGKSSSSGGGGSGSWAQQQLQQQQQEERDFAMEHTRLWGPLGHILEAYTWDHDPSADADRYVEITNDRRI